MAESFSEKEIVYYPNGGKSIFYTAGQTAVIIDNGICRRDSEEDVFPYTLITDKQNEYMHRYDKVFRFLAEDRDQIVHVIKGIQRNVDFVLRVPNRADNAEASPLEFRFEQNFTNVYGSNALKYLAKEYGIVDADGRNYFLDYFVRTEDGGIAVEENGVSYHHPQIIGIEQYRRQLRKQNACTQWGIKLFRFSTEDLIFENRIEDDIRTYFGKDTGKFKENGLTLDRKVKLYDHQLTTLQDMEEKRAEGVHAFLIVFPTASGKSKIIEEDIKKFADGRTGFKALILAPNTNIIHDWHQRIEDSLREYKDRIEVHTYAYMVRNYTRSRQDEYTYIVIDEAHHAVAPMLKRVIQYFTPEFMVGLTATDQRPDRKKLESIFGSYKTSLSLIDAMEKGIVARANVYRLETNIDLSHVRFNGKDYVNADLEKSIRVNSRNELIVQVLKEYFCDGAMAERQGIIFCVNTKHTAEMERLLNAAGIKAKAYTGQTKKPEQVMGDFRDKKIRLPVNFFQLLRQYDLLPLKQTAIHQICKPLLLRKPTVHNYVVSSHVKFPLCNCLNGIQEAEHFLFETAGMKFGFTTARAATSVQIMQGGSSVTTLDFTIIVSDGSKTYTFAPGDTVSSYVLPVGEYTVTLMLSNVSFELGAGTGNGTFTITKQEISGGDASGSANVFITLNDEFSYVYGEGGYNLPTVEDEKFGYTVSIIDKYTGKVGATFTNADAIIGVVEYTTAADSTEFLTSLAGPLYVGQYYVWASGFSEELGNYSIASSARIPVYSAGTPVPTVPEEGGEESGEE